MAERPWMKRIFVSFLMALTIGLYSQVIFAKDVRFGVMFPEDTQKQAAVKAAAEVMDEPLQEPEVEVTVPVDDVTKLLEPLSELERKVSDTLDPISLEEEIQKQVVQGELEQFGYEIFSQAPTTFAPVEGIPVPSDYVIGPGDTFIVQVFGVSDVEYRLVVTRDGKLLVPEIGGLDLAGLTFNEAKEVIRSKISKSRIGAKTIVTIADLHTIQIMMVGEVVKPGSYTVSGLSSLLNTLITTGGVKRTGSLRNIQVRRNNKIVATLDLYDVLLKGVNASNIYLRQGDVVFVPPIGKTVSIAGEVHRPAIYELKNEKRVEDVVSLSGGLLPTAAGQKSHIERITDSGLRTLVSLDLQQTGGQKPVKNGDLIRVFSALNKMENVVLLNGHVIAPGGYEWRPNMRVSDLIKTRQILRQSVDYDIAIIQRELPSPKRIKTLYFDLGNALDDPSSVDNLKLKPRDQVIIFDTANARHKQVAGAVQKMKKQSSAYDPPHIVELKGYLQHTGVFPLQYGARLLEVLELGGGIQEGTDMKYVLLVRKYNNEERIEFIRVNLAADYHCDRNPVILPEDKIYVFDYKMERAPLIRDDLDQLKKQTGFGDLTPVLTVTGSVISPGMYPLTPGMRIEDLITAAGGMVEKAFGGSAILSRQELINGEFTVTDHMDIRYQSSKLLGFDSSKILHPYDHLILKEKPEWVNKPKMVKLEGEFTYPGEYRVGKRETLCSLVQRAGGFTEDAYLFGSVFLRDSVKKREQEALDRIYEDLDDLLVDVHLSPGVNKDTKLPVNKAALEIKKIINQLGKPKAAGRLVVDIQSAVNACNERNDIVLEDGDRIIVPKYSNEVSVVGQVYHPTSHFYREDRAVFDYINLSGGTKELAMREHTYIVQANGEVMTVRSAYSSWGWLGDAKNIKVTPGATIYVPLSVDRINGREFTESWVEIVYKLVISAASMKYLYE